MWPFICKSCALLRVQVAELRGQLTDREEFLLKYQEESLAERKDLLDRVMSLSRPEALREFKREPLPARPPQAQAVRSSMVDLDNIPRPVVVPPPKIAIPRDTDNAS